MLRYLASGLRDFGATPMPLHRRVNWEFFAVVEGKCAPILAGDDTVAPVAETLWAFPPQTPHGWRGEPAQPCRVVVLHFSTVPAALEDAARDRGFLSRRLDGDARSLLVELSRSLKPHYWDPTQTSDIYMTKALMELSLLFVEQTTSLRVGPRAEKLKRVQQFEDWMREHLARGASIDEGARAVGLSPSQLRRICHAVRQMGPTEILRGLRIERAKDMIAKQNAKLTAIAAECGFSTAANFCRAFKAATGATPGHWRNEIYVQYRKPRSRIAANYKEHGRRRAFM